MKRFPLSRFVSLVIVFAVVLGILVIPAHAADISTKLSMQLSYAEGANAFSAGSASIDVPASNVSKASVTHARGVYDYFISKFDIGSSSDTYSGAVGVYISFYMTSISSKFSSTGFVEGFKGVYTNHEGNTGEATATVEEFTPSSSTAVSTGHSIKTKFVGTEDFPISYLRLFNTTTNGITQSDGYNSSHYAGITYTSARVISTEYSAELDAMESMANNIAQQNEIMQAMYGEIIALCNAIYNRLGDLETALNLTNSYCSAMLDALGDIASTTNNIYTLLGTQFSLLISTIQTESSNIQQAIADAESKLEAYFDGAVADSGIVDAGQASDDASASIGGLSGAESGYRSTASESFSAISADFAGFSGGTLSGIALATDLFAQVFDSLGEYKIVYTFPLLLGVCLVIIGRISRHNITKSSGKDDKEE